MSAGCGCERGHLATLDEVLSELQREALALPAMEVLHLPLREVCGAVLAEPVISAVQVPPADNSAMDGYALRAADVVNGAELVMSQRIPAGAAPQALQPAKR